jgi:hypothetical protein
MLLGEFEGYNDGKPIICTLPTLEILRIFD